MPEILLPLMSYVFVTTFTPGPNNITSAALGMKVGYRGSLRYLLRSPLIEHFQQQALTRLSEPDLEPHDAPDPPRRITARRGVIRNASETRRNGDEEVELQENVHMRQTYDDGRRYHLRTPSITIYPQREYAETDQNVMITTHAGRTKAVGLEGSLDKGLLKMFS